MNKNYYNGKHNIIKPNMSLKDEAFKIRKQELDNDEVFSGNLILRKEFDNLDYDKIFSLPLDDNLIYVNDVNYSHNHLECSIDDSIIYCGSFVLWFLEIIIETINLYLQIFVHIEFFLKTYGRR